MIGTIVIGRGNERRVFERNRNRADSIGIGKAICSYVGIALTGPYKPKR